MSAPQLYEHKIKKLVEFCETDAAGIMHFSNFLGYMEACEHSMFRSLGLSVNLNVDGVPYRLPRGHVECRFVVPLKFDDEVEIHLMIREIRRTAIVNQYIMRQGNGDSGQGDLGQGDSEQGDTGQGDSGQVVAIGSMTIVFALQDATGTLRATAIPQALADLIQVAPPELFDKQT